ncbi:MAG: class I SAM-dependent methyltransferase [Patescibacteria group bacterium]
MNYRDKFYSKYISTHTAYFSGEISLGQIKKQFPVWRRYFGRFLPKDKNTTLIDLGCGTGGFVYWLQQIGYQNSEGIDISVEQIAATKKLGINHIQQADLIEFLSDKSNVYDAVFMRDVIEHFPKEKIIDVLEQIYRSLKIGGVVVIQTPNAESPFSGRFRYGDFTHEVSLGEGSIRQVLRMSNFNNIKVFPTRPVIHGLKSFVRAILWRGIELILQLYLLIETGSVKGIFTQNLIARAKKTPIQ